ncbi:F-box protein [Legionella qingyii]|nr:F-box protein [Legionella qingyii]
MKIFDLLGKLVKSKNKPMEKLKLNGDLAILPLEILKEIVSYLDLKSVLNLRTLSQEQLEKINLLLKDEKISRKLGIVSEDMQGLFAVGQNVQCVKFKSSDFYTITPSTKAIKKSFQSNLTLFKDRSEATKYMDERKIGTERENVAASKPYLALVTVKKPNTLFKVKKQDDTNNALTVTSSQEISDKLKFVG